MMVGKQRSPSKTSPDYALQSLYDIYATRLSTLSLSTLWHKTGDGLVKAVDKDVDKQHAVVLLDVLGDQMSSEAFQGRVSKCE